MFHTSWEKVFRAVEMAVQWGRAYQDLSGVSAIGIDEIAWQRGHRYLTLVYQIEGGIAIGLGGHPESTDPHPDAGGQDDRGRMHTRHSTILSRHTKRSMPRRWRRWRKTDRRCSPSTISQRHTGSTFARRIRWSPLSQRYGFERTRRGGCLSRRTGLAMVHQLAMSAQKGWRRLRRFKQLADVIAGVRFIGGVDERTIESRRNAA